MATLIGFFSGVAVMVGVAHFCGEPEEEEEDEEEGEGDEEEMEAKKQQSLPLDFMPAMRKATSLSFGKLHSPTPPPSPLIGRGGMVRAPTLGRRRSLMETYRVRWFGRGEGGREGGREKWCVLSQCC